MVKRPRGYLSRATRKLKRKRKLTVVDHMKTFEPGQKVCIDPQPYYKGALPHMRYRGRVGVVKERRGKAYVVEITDGNKKKMIISSPVHLKEA